MKQSNIFIYTYFHLLYGFTSNVCFIALFANEICCVVDMKNTNFKEQFLAVVDGTYLLYADNIIIHLRRVHGFILLTPKLGKTI